MKLFLEKIVPFIKHKKPDFRRAAAQCLHGLHTAAPEAFTARMRKGTAEQQRDVAAILAPLVPGFTIGDSAGTASLRKTARKAPLPGRDTSEAAATVIQSVARGRRGRKLSKEMQRQSQEAKPCQCKDTAAASTTSTEVDDASSASHNEGSTASVQRDQEWSQPPSEESLRQKQKPAIPRQKPTPTLRKLPTKSTSAQKQQSTFEPSPAAKQQEQKQQEEKVEKAKSQHPLFAHKPPPDTERREQLEKQVATLRRTGSASLTPSIVVAAEDNHMVKEEPTPAETRVTAMQKCADEISQRADDEDTTELLQHLRQLCDLVTRSAADEVQQSLPDIFGPLRDCMDHKGVEVRKVVVCTPSLMIYLFCC